MPKETFEEFKKNHEDYYKKMFEKNKKLFKTDRLFLDGKEITIEEAMRRAYEAECIYDRFVDTVQKKTS